MKSSDLKGFLRILKAFRVFIAILSRKLIKLYKLGLTLLNFV